MIHYCLSTQQKRFLGGLDQKTNKFSGGDCTIWGGSKTFNHSSLSLPYFIKLKRIVNKKIAKKKHKSHKKTAAGGLQGRYRIYPAIQGG